MSPSVSELRRIGVRELALDSVCPPLDQNKMTEEERGRAVRDR